MNDTEANNIYRINHQRLQHDFHALTEIGKTHEAGIDRPAFSRTHQAARSWFREQTTADGFDFHIDSAGNHSTLLNCGKVNAPTFLIGSHLDSLAFGCIFESSIGLPAALEVLRSIRDTKASLGFNLEAIDFTDKKGFIIGQMGSRALAGKLSFDDLQNPRGGRDNLLDGLQRAGLSEDGLTLAARDPSTLAGYLELQIDQGNQLKNAQAEIGIVTQITGICSYRLRFTEIARSAWEEVVQNYADSFQCASAFINSSRQLLLERFPDCTINVGAIQYGPQEPGTIPRNAELSLEFRSLELPTLMQLEGELINLAHTVASRHNISLDAQFLEKLPPVVTDSGLQKAIAQSAKLLGIQPFFIKSMAGQNAQSLSDLCPTGVILIPMPDPLDDPFKGEMLWEEYIQGVEVLLNTVISISPKL